MPSSESRPKTSEPQIAAIILTCNEEINLPLCLASFKGLDAEIFVVDSGSTDRTREIAVAAGAKVFEHPFQNYSAQRNWAQNSLPIRSEWILHLDADERLTPDLVGEIGEVLRGRREGLGVKREAEGARPEALGFASDADTIDGFLLRKRTFFMGRWIRHGGHYPSYHLRLFRKGKGFCEERLYDQHFVVSGKIATLKHDYLDVLCSDINTWIERHTRWAELEAKQLLMGSNGKAQVRPALFGSPIERRRWMRNSLYGRSPLYLRAFLYWVYRYFFRLGFLDGKEGFVFHFMQGFWFRLLVDIRLDELRKQETAESRVQKSEVGRQA